MGVILKNHPKGYHLEWNTKHAQIGQIDQQVSTSPGKDRRKAGTCGEHDCHKRYMSFQVTTYFFSALKKTCGVSRHYPLVN
jgi:hypothetical protein